MEKLSEIIASELDEVIKLYDPVIGSLSDRHLLNMFFSI